MGDRAVARWLFLCCIMVALMVWVGGMTRLTESGLSITEWKPVTGAIPPLSDTAWQAEFAKYQQSPEYVKKNSGMSLGEFKQIFLWEYTHRLIARSIGVVFLLPFLYFLAKKRITRPYANAFVGIFLLGGLQGFIGWYMVKSGLVDRPDVSQYRLALHLGMAFLLYGLMLWTGLSLWGAGPHPSPLPRGEGVRRWAMGITLMIAIQILSGAFVAGLDAGLVYNTFPTMNGAFIPQALWTLDPWYKNLFENVTTVQFNHRVWAMLTSAAIIALWCYAQRQRMRQTLKLRQRNLIHAMLVMLIIQISLGVATLLLVVPISLASAHQMGALALFTLAVMLWHGIRKS